MKYFIVCFAVSAMMAACYAGPKKESDILHAICEKNNLFEIYEKERLSFSFNARLPDKTIKRDWVWDIRENRVFLNGIQQEGMAEKFVNDIYWLLFPLKACEDKGEIELTVNRGKHSPLTGIECSEVIIKYTSGKGYTPNDTYRLYVDSGLTIVEWAYLKGGQEPPIRVTDWKDYRNINGVNLSLVREGRDDFKVWFTDVVLE